MNLPVAANVVDKFDESVDPENPSYHQDADEEAVCLDSASKKRQVVGDRSRQVT